VSSKCTSEVLRDRRPQGQRSQGKKASGQKAPGTERARMVFSGKVFGMREEAAEFAKEDHREAVEVEEVHGEVLEIPLELLAQMRTAVKAGGAPVEASQQLLKLSPLRLSLLDFPL